MIRHSDVARREQIAGEEKKDETDGFTTHTRARDVHDLTGQKRLRSPVEYVQMLLYGVALLFYFL